MRNRFTGLVLAVSAVVLVPTVLLAQDRTNRSTPKGEANPDAAFDPKDFNGIWDRSGGGSRASAVVPAMKPRRRSLQKEKKSSIPTDRDMARERWRQRPAMTLPANAIRRECRARFFIHGPRSSS